MAYCSNCGNKLPDGTQFCPDCGAPQGNGNTAQRMAPTPPDYPYANQASGPQNGYNANQPSQPVDNGGFGWALLGFCIPIVGLILFLVWNDTKPKTARAAGKGALVSVIVGVLFYVLGIGGSIAAGLML